MENGKKANRLHNGYNIVGLFVSSAKDLKNVKKLMIISLFTALTVAAKFADIPISKDLFISFTFVVMAICGFLFGPVATCLVGIAADLLGFLIYPRGPFFIGFTVSAALSGIVYGVFLYKKNYKSEYFIIWCAVSKIIINFAVNIVLNSIWVNSLYGKSAVIFTTMRIYKNVVMLPFEILILFFVLKYISKPAKKMNVINY